MSLPQRETIRCPKCGKEFEVTAYQSINDRVPDAAKKIMTGELFLVRCPHCGHKDRLEYDILFNDFEHRAWIQVVHEEGMIPIHTEALKLMKSYTTDIDLRLRIVRSVSELRQKVTAFVMGRDDRVIELCKYAAVGFIFQQEPDFPLLGDPVYAANPETGEEFVFLYGEEGEEKCLPLTEELIGIFAEVFEAKATEEDAGRYVYDFDWADEFLARAGKQ